MSMSDNAAVMMMMIQDDDENSQPQHKLGHDSMRNPNDRPMGSASTATLATAADHSTVTFVDYRRPPAARVQPPSKYKLWLLVFVLVYFAVWAGEGANLSEALRFRGWLSPDGAQFLELAITVFVLVFGALDFVVAMLTFRYKGQEYGLGPWMKCGHRIQWVHQNRFSDSFILECVKGAIQILEDGFGMFNAAPNAAAAATITPQQLGRPRSNKAKRSLTARGSSANTQHNDFGKDGEEEEEEEEERDYTYHSSDSRFEEEASYRCTSDNCQTLVKIEHRINPDKMEEYHQWEKRIQRAAAMIPGLISVKKMDIVQEEKIVDRAGQKVVVNDAREPVDVEIGRPSPSQPTGAIDNVSEIAGKRTTFRHSPTTGYSTTTNLHTVFLTFEDIYSLNDWMMSPRRKALMKQLEPLLAVPDQELIQAERAASARDAFTNLTIQQGLSSPTLPPKKWKVWWLTTVALVNTVRWTDSFMAYYLELWGLDQSHPRLRTLVIIFVVTFLTSYVMTPFLLFLFHPWLIRKPNEIDERFIWRTLDDGLSRLWLKFVLTFAFYGGCIIAWIVQTCSR
jgi:antibiotic biosynthesis monooxygenase (ABM) superfamily enzyme